MDEQVLDALERFLSTLPARGATTDVLTSIKLKRISIHAPREGSDGCSRLLLPRPTDFYPRSPRGERHYLRDGARKSQKNFYPRSPRGERRG